MAQSTLKANKELVHELVEATNEQQWDRLRDLYADDLTVELMQDEGGTEEVGIDEIIESRQEFLDSFPDATSEVKEMAAEGDWVFSRLMVEGTHEGEWKGIEPTGNEVSMQFHNQVRIEDGEVVETHGTGARFHLLAQLGVEPPFETED
jgi:predicted ester cyclase